MEQKDKKQKRTVKQWTALIAVILIGLMILGMLVSAIVDPTGVMFRSFLLLTIAVPILAWIYIWLYGMVTAKHTIASMDLNLGSEDLPGTEEESMETEETSSEDPSETEEEPVEEPCEVE